MLIVGFPAGPWQTNCYLVATGEGRDCVIVDPGMDATAGIAGVVAERRLTPVAVLVTHGHLDHMWSVRPVCDEYDIPAYIHPADRHLLADPMAGMGEQTRAAFQHITGSEADFAEPAVVREVIEGSSVDIADLAFRVLHNPGHTKGSVSFLLPSAQDRPQLVFTGDFLFAGSIGRTDLPSGNMDEMVESLGRVVLPMVDDTVVLPGHGETTTVGAERATNPYLRDVADQLRERSQAISDRRL
ncbi:MAG: MBL fold metallo-hydrolase [Actinomycetes bacterium]